MDEVPVTTMNVNVSQVNQVEKSKWYQGWKNIIALLSFCTLFWPISVVIMWLIATWEKKTKWIITGIFGGLSILVYISVFGGILARSSAFNGDVFSAIAFLKITSSIWWIVVLLTLVTSTVFSFILKSKGEKLGKLWTIAGVVIGIAFILILFSTMMSVSSIYQNL